MPTIASAAQCPHPATSPTHAPRPTSPSTPKPTNSSHPTPTIASNVQCSNLQYSNNPSNAVSQPTPTIESNGQCPHLHYPNLVNTVSPSTPTIASAAQCPHPASLPTNPPRPTSPSTPKPTNSINVGLLNVCSIKNKVNDILDIIIDKNIHVFCLTETWLKEGQSSVITSFVPDTHVFHHFSRPKRRGGGVGIVISKNFDNVKAFNRFNDQFESIELHAAYQKNKNGIQCCL